MQAGKLGLVSTVAELREQVGTAGMVGVVTSGIYADNDGGAGLYFWDETTDNPVDDNVTLIVPHKGIKGFWRRAYSKLWDDLRISPGFRKGGANNPTIIAFRDSYASAFDLGDYYWFSSQLPHAWRAKTDLHLHLHWSPHARGATESGKLVTWKVSLTSASIGGVFPPSTVYTLHDLCDGVDWKHQIVEATVNVPGDGLGLSEIIMGRIYRDNIAADTWDGTAANAPAITELDFHIQNDLMGSREEYVK